MSRKFQLAKSKPIRQCSYCGALYELDTISERKHEWHHVVAPTGVFNRELLMIFIPSWLEIIPFSYGRVPELV